MKFFHEHYDKEIISTLEQIVAKQFIRCPYTDAVAILEKCGEKFDYPVSWGIDLQSEHERYLTEKHFKSPVTLFDYPPHAQAVLHTRE